MFEIEFRSTTGIARCFAAGPGSDVATGLGSEIVARNPKGLAGDFDVDTTEQTRIVQAVGFESGRVAVVVEVSVEDGAVMLPAGNEGDGFAAEEEIVRILWM